MPEPTPVAVLLMGLPGAGKTTVARAIADQFAWPIISRDDLRPVLLPVCGYSESEKDFEVDVVRQAVGLNLGLGRSVVVDGVSFEKESYLPSYLNTIAEFKGRATVVLLDVPVATASIRVEGQRARGEHAASDRDAALVQRVAAMFSEVPSWVPVVNAEAPISEVIEAVRTLVLRSTGGGDPL